MRYAYGWRGNWVDYRQSQLNRWQRGQCVSQPISRKTHVTFSSRCERITCEEVSEVAILGRALRKHRTSRSADQASHGRIWPAQCRVHATSASPSRRTAASDGVVEFIRINNSCSSFASNQGSGRIPMLKRFDSAFSVAITQSSHCL